MVSEGCILKRLLRLRAGAVPAFAAALIIAAVASEGSPPRKLNVLLITIDTLRADRVGVYDPGKGRTPEIDRWASESAVFLRAFAHTPTTLPSHTSILLGTAPPHHGVHDNAGFVVRGDFLTLAEHLKGYGYATGAFVGGFPLAARFGLNQGFDVYDDDFSLEEPGIDRGRERRAQAVLDRALAWLKGRTTPWFLWIHCYDPHDPYSPPEPFLSKAAGDLYGGEVAYTDAVIGRLFRALESGGLSSSTLTVLTGDHGESLGEHGEKTHGFLAYNATIHVPLIIRWPGQIRRRVRQNVSHVDIFPTVCDVLDIPKPPQLQGATLLPLFGGKEREETSIFFEALSAFYNLGWGPVSGFILRDEKYIESPIPEIYDLDRDFDEVKNLAPGRDIGPQKDRFDGLLRQMTSEAGRKAGAALDREAQEKLRSLGYLAGRPGGGRKSSGPETDVKTLLPWHNKSMEGIDLWQAGKVREGIETLKEVITANPKVSTAYLNLATVYKTQGRPQDALSVLRMGLDEMPDIYDLYVQTIIALYDAGRYAEAIKAFHPESYPQIASDPIIWNSLGLAYWRSGDVARARANFETSISIDKAYAVPHNNLGALLLYQFKATNEAAFYRSAVEHYDRAIALDPSYSAASHGLGVAHFQAKDYDRAIPNLKRARELDSTLDEALYFLGLAYFAKGDRVQALRVFTDYKNSPGYTQLSTQEKARVDDYIAKSR